MEENLDLADTPELEEIEESKTIENRGKPMVCKYCKFSFKIPDIEAKKLWQNNNCICPKCGEVWCTLPPTERKLKYLQVDYLDNRCEETIAPFIQLLDIYTQSLIKKNYKVYLTWEGSLEYYSYHSVVAFIEEYLKREDFKVDVSFGGYLIWKIKQAVFNPLDLDPGHVSLDYEFEDGNNLHGMIACEVDTLSKIEIAEDTKKLYTKIVDIIEGVSEYCKDPYEDYIRTIAIYLNFKSGENAFDALFQAFGREGRMKSLDTLEILRRELESSAELCYGEAINCFVPKAEVKTTENTSLKNKMLELNSSLSSSNQEVDWKFLSRTNRKK